MPSQTFLALFPPPTNSLLLLALAHPARVRVWCMPLRLHTSAIVKLAASQEVISEWLGCQRNWMYLQPIFDSDDINRQLPAEGKRFSSVDRLWRKTLERVQKVRTRSRLASV
eukprot:6189805-Pleurochrysis_carterae.AAC.8